MAPARPVAQLIWDGSTGTGTGAAAEFGLGTNHVTVLIDNPSTETFSATVEAGMGYSRFAELHTISGATTGVQLEIVSTGETVVDKVRMNLSANATTGVLKIWAVGSP